MQIYLNSITGIDDAICAIKIKENTLTRDEETKIRNTVSECSNMNIKEGPVGVFIDMNDDLQDLMGELVTKSTEMVEPFQFINIACSLYDVPVESADEPDSSDLIMSLANIALMYNSRDQNRESNPVMCSLLDNLAPMLQEATQGWITPQLLTDFADFAQKSAG